MGIVVWERFMTVSITPVAHHSTKFGTAVAGVNHLPCVQSYLTKVYFLGWEFLAGNFC